MNAREEEVLRTLREELRLHEQLMRADGAREYLNGVRDWLFFHAPHTAPNLLHDLALGFVREAAGRVRAGGRVGPPPLVPRETRAVWEGVGDD